MSNREIDQVIAKIFDSEKKSFARFLATPDDKIPKGSGCLVFRATTDPSEQFADEVLGKSDVELRFYEDPKTHVKETFTRTGKPLIVKRVRQITDVGRVTDVEYLKWTPKEFEREYTDNK